ncbi:MAG: DUF4097 family beta strand repeat protein [Clostridia bacterium]|nr:DUF4097 family beta strand repeat protein [Clostridia bacterium]
MKKLTLLILALLCAVPLASCNAESVVLDEVKTYEVMSDIHSLNIQINAADFMIKHAEEFSVESNLKHLSVSEKDGVLTVVDQAKGNAAYADAIFILYVPNDVAFDQVKLVTGAAKLTAVPLSADSMELKLGAGDASFDSLNATSRIDMKGGAGQITVVGGTLNNLTLEMGVGELNLTAALLGNNELSLGVGESNVTLLGSKEDYKVEIEKGIGSITVDGENVSNFDVIGNGKSHVEISGGIGAINLSFQAE